MAAKSGNAKSGINWVYPSNGQSCWEVQVLLVGSVPAGASLVVSSANQKQVVPVSPSGYFSGAATLNAKAVSTSVTLTATLPNGQTLTETRIIHHAAVASGSPRWVVPQVSNHSVVVSAGVAVPVRLEGLSGQVVFFHWLNAQGATVSSQTIQPFQGIPDTQQNIFGERHWLGARPPEGSVVETVLRVPDEPVTALQCQLEGRVLQSVSVEWRSQPWLRVLTQPESPMTKAAIVLRSEPTTNAPRLTPQWSGAQAWVLAEWGDWACLQLERQHTAWVPSVHLSSENVSTSLVLRTLGSQSPDADTVVFNLEGRSGAGRSLIEWEISPDDARWTLHQTGVACDVLPQPRLGNQWPYVHAAAYSDGTAIPHARLHYQPPAGRVLSGMAFKPADNAGWQWRLRHFPADKSQWRIVLDAGHGGNERGGTAPNGVPEKDLNLAVTLACETALRQAGFQHLHLTRRTDTDVSLADRVAQAVAFEPHIVLSLHHNALPDGRNPADYRGLSTFYYYPQARPLAVHLLGQLSSAIQLPQDKLYWDNLALTRIPDAASVLVEWGYLTHPEDAEVYSAKGFAQTAARALANALLSFQPSATLA